LIRDKSRQNRKEGNSPRLSNLVFYHVKRPSARQNFISDLLNKYRWITDALGVTETEIQALRDKSLE
jgi:hypothetical protein